MTLAQWQSVRGTRIRLLQAGAGEPVLYLHGSGGGGAWLPFFDRLTPSYRVLAPEHPGFGESDSLPEADNIEDYAYFYLDFLDTLGLNQVRLIGASLGGWLAMEMACIEPRRFPQLVLVGSAGIRVEGVPVPDVFMLDEAEHTRLLFYNQELAEQRLSAMGQDDAAVLARQRSRAAVAHLAWNPYFHRPKLRDRLHRIQQPVLLVWGEQDRVFPVAYGQSLAGLLPQAQLQVVPACGHLVAQEKPAELAGLVQEFFARRGEA
ncbi:MAG: alpha/beta fold hydrolase [Alicyclobacillus sp.]|nr:alpha/beta fold hydrolase [Alicyclobacillus sp.]